MKVIVIMGAELAVSLEKGTEQYVREIITYLGFDHGKAGTSQTS